MKRIKKPILIAILFSCILPCLIGQQYMRINQSDGNVLKIPIADIQKLTFDLTTSLHKHPELVKQLLKLKVFPNPGKEYIMLDYSLHEKGNVNIEIYNMQGLLIERINQGIQNPGNYNLRINTHHLTAGTYICRVRQNDKSVTRKIFINN